MLFELMNVLLDIYTHNVQFVSLEHLNTYVGMTLCEKMKLSLQQTSFDGQDLFGRNAYVCKVKMINTSLVH